MKTLIFTAQPSSKGFVHTLASQYNGTKNNTEIQSEIINLYDEEYHIPFLQFENIREIEASETVTKLQDKIADADELVFIFPLWWGSMPAILKNFFDNVFGAGFAFTYENGRPKGLLTGKTAKIITTYDSPSWRYWFTPFPIKKLIKTNILKFCGMKTTDFLDFKSIGKATTQDKNKILETITKLALK
ncbi:TPA: NAD(P)H-dependent oxidoreductase [Candidatus Gracilibacteria bacterium]|nr:hypothetical protein [Candidatus Peregrinibacteria bacterium]HIQ56843.1 NAD(P)H-dependent oxidoreductase [Candidatus Gracilibacteria bacterium]HIQ57093.1 NAD(P)H-dependent oxidoreductase [Candidatus Gracilibacteria bacterium]